jgi:PucR C-terminal helix-turn-helix domain
MHQTPTESERDTLSALVDRVDASEIARRMVTAFRSEISGYARLPESVIAGQILEVSRRNVELFFRSITELRGPTEEELAPFRESARSRAEEGLPLEDLLHAYRLGGRLGWQALMEAAHPNEYPALLAAAALLMRYIDSVSAAVAQTYLDEHQHLVSEEERRQRALVEALIHPEREAPALRDLAERVGFPIADRYRPFAKALPGAPTHAHSQLASALRSRGLLALTEGDRVTGLAVDTADETAIADGSGLFTLGRPTPRSQLRVALDDMRLLLDLARRQGVTGPVDADAFVPELLLARSPDLAARITERVLGPLEAYAERRSSGLLETLEAFLDCGLDRRQAAGQLHIHPNTLDYRLRRITELTGLEPGRPRDLVLLELALTRRKLALRPRAVDPGRP